MKEDIAELLAAANQSPVKNVPDSNNLFISSLVKIPTNSSNVYFEVNKNEYEYTYRKDLDKLVLITELVKDGEVLSRNSFYFKPFKELKIEKPTVEYVIKKTDSGFDFELKTDKLAKNVYLQIGDEKGFFSDNYFDLLPNEKVKINLKTDISEEKLKEVLTLRTLDDAF